MSDGMRVLLDTNLYVSYLLSSPNAAGPVGAVVEAAINRAYILLLPEELLEEFFDKITTKPYLADRIRANQAQDFVRTLRSVATLLPSLSAPVPAVCRDPEDDYLLAHALASDADYLVTGDKDLLALATAVAPLKILDPAAFLRELP